MAELLWTLTKKLKCNSLLRVSFLLLLTLALALFGYRFLKLKMQKLETMLSGPSMVVRELDNQQVVNLSRGELDNQQVVKVSELLHFQPNLLLPSRGDVLVLTPWLAPIIWEGTFDIDILNEQFLLQNTTIGLTVFAIQKHMVFLRLFLESAEKNFMVGHRVNYYIFTDQPDSVPRLTLKEDRQMVVLQVQNYSRLYDISMHRMEMISNLSAQHFLHEVDYLVCADVNVKFSNHVGVEILSSLFGTLHPGFFGLTRSFFSYEHRPHSQAYIPESEGDFYYIRAFFGGSVREVYRLTKACHQAMMVDKANGIEAVWQDESHLNKYLLYHRPTKILSPEYLMDKPLLKFSGILENPESNTIFQCERITRHTSYEEPFLQEFIKRRLRGHPSLPPAMLS